MAFAGLPPLPSPHTRIGVGGVLIRDGRALVNRAVYRERFTIPSGYVEHGEALETALVREFEEETGVTVRVGPLVLTRHKVIGPEESDVYFAFAVARISGDPVARPPEIAEVREVAVAGVDTVTWISELSRRAIHVAARPEAGWSRAEGAIGHARGFESESYHP